MDRVRVILDCKGLKDGGGLTHVVNLIEIWSNEENVRFDIRLYRARHITSFGLYSIDGPSYSYWRSLIARLKIIFGYKIDVIFSPSGRVPVSLAKKITMCRNMLVFEKNERNRFKFTKDWFRFRILEIFQIVSYSYSNKVIFLNSYARDYVCNLYPWLQTKAVIVPHGKPNLSFEWKNFKTLRIGLDSPFRLVYVSTLNHYKHQDKVIKAVTKLRSLGYNVELELIGSIRHHYLPKIKEFLELEYIEFRGKMTFNGLIEIVQSCHLSIFASSCENMPNTLIELMSLGIPVVSSNKRPMSDYYLEKDVLFNPDDHESIAEAILKVGKSLDTQRRIMRHGLRITEKLSWEQTAEETANLLESICVE